MRHLILISLVLLLFSACDDALPDDEEQDSPLVPNLVLQSNSIDIIQDLQAEYTVTNLSDSTLSFRFDNSCQHVFLLERDMELVLDSRNLYGCQDVITHLDLDPMDTQSYSITMENVPDDFVLESGEYRMTAFLKEVQGSEVSADLTVE